MTYRLIYFLSKCRLSGGLENLEHMVDTSTPKADEGRSSLR